MICLYCETELSHDRPQTCPECEMKHRTRAPVVGINHVSQLLDAVDSLRKGDCEPADLTDVVEAFSDLFEAFEEKWSFEEASLTSRLAPSLQARFGAAMKGIDDALAQGTHALELLQNLDPEPSVESLDEAEAALIAFFQGICSHAAVSLEAFDTLKAESQSSGALFNLPSV